MEQTKQTLVHVLSSLVRQLAGQISDLPAEIEDLYEEKRQERPTLDELLAVFLKISKIFVQVFVVFDALDECDQDDQRHDLLPLFHLMGKSGINVFLTSRKHPEDIQESLVSILKIEIWAHD